MNKNEIVRQYKRVKLIDTIFFKGSDFFIKLFLKVFLVPINFLLTIGLYILLDSFNISSDLSFLIAFTTPACFVSLICIKTNFLEWINHISTFNRLSIRFFQPYEKKWGMTRKQIENYISYRKQLGDDGFISYLQPIISQLCQLNQGAEEEQKRFLSGFLNKKELKLVFDKEYSDAQIESAYQYWRGKELGKKKTLMELLFKLTVEQDGIHNDEWKLLIQIMTQLKFNNRYIEYFKNRYSPLRTEFDDYERKSTSTLGEYSVASLKPYYAVLGLKEEASIEEIKQAYHNLALQHHPDLPKNADRIEECEEMMMKINDAYEKLQR